MRLASASVSDANESIVDSCRIVYAGLVGGAEVDRPPLLVRLGVVRGEAEPVRRLRPPAPYQFERRGGHADRLGEPGRDADVLGEQAEREAGAVAAGDHVVLEHDLAVEAPP